VRIFCLALIRTDGDRGCKNRGHLLFFQKSVLTERWAEDYTASTFGAATRRRGSSFDCLSEATGEPGVKNLLLFEN
jgi:hypothetical protein